MSLGNLSPQALFTTTKRQTVLAEALSRHPHDTVRLLQAIGAALLLAQDARHMNDELKAIIYAERRRKRQRE